MQKHKQLRGVELKRFVRKNKLRKDFELVFIMLNISYAKNVAAMFRTADAFSVDKVYLIGCTTTPPFGKALKKVSRSKEGAVDWEYREDLPELVDDLHNEDFKIYGLELATNADLLPSLAVGTGSKVALVVGNEAHGIPDKHLELMDKVFYIPMGGRGKSLNVAATAAIGLYQVTVVG